MKLSFHLRVQQEVNEALAWYEEPSEGQGDDLLDQLQLTLARIAEHPSRFSFWLGSKIMRRAKLNRFPYNVIFEVHPDRVRVTCVRHEKQHPNYGSAASSLVEKFLPLPRVTWRIAFTRTASSMGLSVWEKRQRSVHVHRRGERLLHEQDPSRSNTPSRLAVMASLAYTGSYFHSVSGIFRCRTMMPAPPPA